MRFMTGVVVNGVQAMTPAPVFRASETSAPACRLVVGQECSAAAAWQLDSVSGVGLAGAADLLGLVVLGEALLRRHGYVGELGQERPSAVFQQQAPALMTDRIQDAGQPEGGTRSISERDDDSTKRDGNGDEGASGSKPVSPWDFRTSSPPG
jgi:hypothetical protein